MVELAVRSWGSGGRVAVLIHGATTDSGTWSRVGPLLAVRGYQVIAPDLPGHGRSRRSEYTLAGMADAVVEAVPHSPELALGHSLGGLVLAGMLDRLAPTTAVFEDPPWGPPPGPEALAFIDSQREWTIEQVAAFHPRWSIDAVREKHAALALWDPATIALVAEYPGPRPVPPTMPSLVLVGDTQPMIDDRLAGRLRTEGYHVQQLACAGHNIHNDDPDAFVAALDGWLQVGGPGAAVTDETRVDGRVIGRVRCRGTSSPCRTSAGRTDQPSCDPGIRPSTTSRWASRAASACSAVK